MWPQMKERWLSPEAIIEKARNEFSPRWPGASTVLFIPRFWPNETGIELLTSGKVREYISVVLSYQVCGILLHQSQDASTNEIHDPQTPSPQLY